ncbi:deoxyribodipyrimidine photo-lyase [Bradyrhizobium iriomotense]|uniref:deoxyribodipyrimidine photo-lyase n=1 Tax=Bradyrhizobium iriomotense TaxID=441950 RepID=UPI003D9ACB00
MVWFRDDLRLSDDPALDAAARIGAPVAGAIALGARRAEIAVADPAPGAAVRVIPDLARESGARTLDWNGIAERGRTGSPIVDHASGRERAFAVCQRSAKVERCFDTIVKPAIVIAPYKPWGTIWTTTNPLPNRRWRR